MNALLNIKKIVSKDSSPETINMLNTSMEEITTPFSSRSLHRFKKLKDSISTIKAYFKRVRKELIIKFVRFGKVVEI